MPGSNDIDKKDVDVPDIGNLGEVSEPEWEKVAGIKYETLDDFYEARFKTSFWKKIKLTWQGKTKVGRIVGTGLDVAELFAPKWAVKTRDIIQSQTKPDTMANSKSTSKSKTVITFGLLFLVGLLQLLGVDIGLEMSPDAQWVTTGAGVAGVILRLVTNKPVKLGEALGLAKDD